MFAMLDTICTTVIFHQEVTELSATGGKGLFYSQQLTFQCQMGALS
jgi:hypothetical protein